MRDGRSFGSVSRYPQCDDSADGVSRGNAIEDHKPDWKVEIIYIGITRDTYEEQDDKREIEQIADNRRPLGYQINTQQFV